MEHRHCGAFCGGAVGKPLLDAPQRGAPGFHVLSDIFYHTTLDIPEYVPEAGLESAVRAYAKIIDETNKLDLSRLRSNLGTTTQF